MIRFAPLLILALPLPASAAPASGTATFGAGASLPQNVVVDARTWRCADGACSGPAELRRVAVERLCKDLARKVGTIDTLTVGGMALASEQLADCNKSARAS